MDFYDVVSTRRKITNYADQDISNDILRKIVKAAACAPSGYHAEPWRFVVIRDKEKKKKLAQVHAYARACELAPVVIAVFYDHKKSSPNPTSDFISVAIATQNLLLAARAEGIGSVWIYGDEKHEPQVGKNIRQIIETDNHYESVALIPLGYPQEGEKVFIKKNPAIEGCFFQEKISD